MSMAAINLQNSFAPADQPRSYMGAKALWVKVIIRAVFDWVSYRDSPRLEKRKIAEQAALWIFNQSELFNGFENICAQLDIEPSRIRTWAKSISKDQVAKIEHLDRSAACRGRSSLELKMAEMYWKQPALPALEDDEGL